VKDIHEWLGEIGVEPVASIGQSGRSDKASDPSALRFGAASKAKDQVVTYHESCHLTHGQKITLQPREILRAIPNLKLVDLPESAWCCGSAGIYNLVQPEMANQLLQRKLNHIRSTGATVVATGNPGCLLQLVNGARSRGMNLRVVHPVTLLAEAYRSP